MTTNLSAFNTQIFSLVDELIEIYPEDFDFKTFKNSAEMLKKANARAIVELFNQHIYIHKDKILAKDESFFLNNDFSGQVGGNSEKFLKIVAKLKQYWQDMSTNTKENIWKYFKVFVVLCERYYSQNTLNKTLG